LTGPRPDGNRRFMASVPRLSSRALCAGLLVLGAASAASDARAETRIGVVNVQYAVTQTEDGIRATNTFKKLFDKRQQDLDARQADLAKMREDIERQTRILSRDSLTRRMEDWQKRMVDLQTTYVDHNRELQKKQAELTNPIMKKMLGVVGRIAKKNGFDVIVDAQAVPYVRSDLDLTDQVIQMYNGGGGGDEAGDAKDKKDEKKDEKSEPKEEKKEEKK
jgi:outer membrane protein